MIRTIKTTLSREKLKKQDFTPDRVAIIKNAVDSNLNAEDFYKPLIELLNLIQQDIYQLD